MAGCSKDYDPPFEDAVPHEQEFDTEIERDFMCSEKKFEKVKNWGRVSLSKPNWGRILFELDLQRIKGTEEDEKDLILTVACNKGAHDPHWRCAFTVTVQSKDEMFNETVSQSLSASKSSNSFDLPITRMTPAMEVLGKITLNIKININKWSGTYPAMIKTFTTKTYLTDATLLVTGERLYVSRAILAMHSTYFNTLFFDHRFPDASRTEFNIDDVALDEFNLFLSLIYPNSCDDQQTIFSMHTIERMLFLAERLGVDCVKRLMEKYLMGEMGEGSIDNFTLARRLLVADRYRLSAPTSMLMNELRDEGNLQRLGSSEEYSELSDSLRASILDMRMQRDEEGGGTSSTFERISGIQDALDANLARIRQMLSDQRDQRPRNADSTPSAQFIRNTAAPSALQNQNPAVASVQQTSHSTSNSLNDRKRNRFSDYLTSRSTSQPQLMPFLDPSVNYFARAPPSFAKFQVIVARVRVLLPSMNPSDLTRRFEEAVSYLTSMTQSQYDGTDSAILRELETILGTIDFFDRGSEFMASRIARTRERLMEKVITIVEELRDDGDSTQASSSKIRKIDHN